MAETPAGWLPPRITGAVVVVTDWVVVGAVVVVVGLVVVGLAVVVVSSVVVGSVVVLEATVVVEAAVVVGSVVVIGVVTGSWLVAPGVACVLVAVVSLQPGASAVGSRPPVVIGRLVADGLVSGLLVDGEGVVVGSVVVPVVKEADVGASSAVVVGRATPGARCGDGAWGGNKVAEATRAARTAVLSPKATSSSLQGHRALARCRGRGVGMCIVPVRLFLPGQGCP